MNNLKAEINHKTENPFLTLDQILHPLDMKPVNFLLVAWVNALSFKAEL